MENTTRHLGIHIDRPVAAVYAYASDPANLPEWAPGLGSSIVRDGDRWVMDSPMGRIRLDFTGPNDYGVLDHHVTLPSGEVTYNPMRVVADDTGSELVFSLRRRPGVTDDDFAADAKAVLADLENIKRHLEHG